MDKHDPFFETMLNYEKLFEALPACYLLIRAEEGFPIVEATDKYLQVTRRTRDIIGKKLFDIFPDNPNDPSATGMKNLSASLNRVMRMGKPDHMPMQRYEMQADNSDNFLVRYWKPANIPIFNEDEKVDYILHSVHDITEEVVLNKRVSFNDQHTQTQVANAVSSTQEMERMEISRELHDNVNQILITAKLYLGRGLEKEPVDANMARKGLELLEKAVVEIRNISLALTHVSQEEEDLVEALENMLGEVMHYGSINVHKEIRLPDESLIHSKVKTTILRIVQEQLANVLKHAEAKNLFIGIEFQNGLLDLTIRDDGKGFELSEKKNGMGFQNMKSRVALIDGSIMIHSAPGDGCTIKVNIPVLSMTA